MSKRYGLRSYLAGATTARLGDEMSGPALLLAGLAATGSGSAASTLLAGVTVASAIGGPAFGAMLDRSPRPGRPLAGALAVYAGALAAMLACLGRVPIAYVVVIAVGAGVFGPALSGGWTAQLPSTVGADALPRASALDAMTFSLAGLAGPALAGIVAEFFGATASMVTAIVLIALALPWAARIPRRQVTHGDRPGLLGGFGAIGRSPALARATAASVIACVSEGILVACSPLLGEASLGGAAHGAILLSVVAAASLGANAVLSRRTRMLRPDTVLWAGTLTIGVALALMALRQPVVLVAAAVLAGIGSGPALSALFMVRHREAPERLRGQIFTTGASLKITALAIGAAISGPIAGWSLSGAMLVAAGFEVLAVTTFAVMTVTARTASHPRSTRSSSASPECS